MNDDLIYARVVNTVHINGQDVEYEAVSEEIPLPDENGGTDATLFMTSYLRLNAEKTGRPILFAFNGGPGSASVFLHLGGLGPQIIDLGDGISAPFDPPFRMKENAACILDICDMVFMDPVGCGYSRALTGDAVKSTHPHRRMPRRCCWASTAFSAVINGGTVLFLSWVKATGQCALH